MMPKRLNPHMLPYVAESFDNLVTTLRPLAGKPVSVDDVFIDTFVDIIFTHFFGRHPVYEGTFSNGALEVAEILHGLFREFFQRGYRPSILNPFYTGEQPFQ
jgi:hypothetical protein